MTRYDKLEPAVKTSPLHPWFSVCFPYVFSHLFGDVCQPGPHLPSQWAMEALKARSPQRLASVGRIGLLHRRKESIDLHDVVQCLETQRELGMVRLSDSDSWFGYMSKGNLRYFFNGMLVLNTFVLGYHGIEFLLKHQLLSGPDGGTQWHNNRMIISNRDYVPSEVESGTGSGHNMIWLYMTGSA